MALTPLITASDVVSIVFPNSNLSTDFFKEKTILECQYQYFHDFFGEDWYDELITQKAAGTLTQAANPHNYTAYNDYLKNSLAYYVAAHSSLQIQTKVSNLGFVHNFEAGESITADPKLVERMRNDFINSGNVWREQCKTFIEHEDNEDNYPTYNTEGAPDRNTAYGAAGVGLFFKRSDTYSTEPEPTPDE